MIDIKEYIYRSQDDLTKLNVPKPVIDYNLKCPEDFLFNGEKHRTRFEQLDQLYLYSYEEKTFECIAKQISDGICFTSLTDAADKMDGEYKWFICGSFGLYLDKKGSSDKFLVMYSDYIPFDYKDMSCVRVVASMSTSKMYLDNPYNNIRDYIYNTLDIWGHLSINIRDGKIISFIIKPIIAGVHWINSLNEYLSNNNSYLDAE